MTKNVCSNSLDVDTVGGIRYENMENGCVCCDRVFYCETTGERNGKKEEKGILPALFKRRGD